MDGLALLCNLFADGPVTLKRLRVARIATLTELERVAPERLAEWLHASVPQARAFVEEARKLLGRLAEAAPAAEPALTLEARPARAVAAVRDARAAGERVLEPLVTGVRPAAHSASLTLRPGLFPGLDESVCARLHQQQVRSVQALSESAGLALARRTGIPYSTLLELARRARRFLIERSSAAQARAAPAMRDVELVPFAPRPRRAPAERELTRTDEFTLPVSEPESAGPFG